MKTKPRVAVIGGGWAGLAAASELAATGIAVTVFEAARQLGGRARCVELNGRRLDNGQHILLGAYRETLRLMQLVGACPQQALRRYPLELNYAGPAFRIKLPRLPAPLHLATALLRTNAPWREKFAAARFVGFLQKQHYRLAADTSVAALLDAAHQSGRLRRHLWEALCLAALNTSPDDASAQIFVNVLRDSLGGTGTDTDLLLPAGDLGAAFPEAAADFIRQHGGEIRLSSRIEVLPENHVFGGKAFDQVVLAVAPQHAAGLLAPLSGAADISRRLMDYRYEPIGTIYAAYRPAIRLPGPMLGLDGGLAERLGQWVIERTPASEETVLSFVLSAHGHWEDFDNDTLMCRLHGELEEALGTPLAQPHWYRVIREKRATFSCRPSLYRPSCATPVRGLWLAGDYVCADYPATLEGAIRSGVAAARAILASN